MSGLERYPDPYQIPLKQKLAAYRQHNLTPANIFVSVGSDEAIDLLMRIFCVPGRNQILITPPTYGMYKVCAKVIVVLVAFYVAVAGARDLMILFAVEDMQTQSFDAEIELFDAATILTFVVSAVDVIFIMRILDALNGMMHLVDTYDEDSIVREEHEWISDAAGELNYFFVLCGVAYLWKPNPSAKEYAYVMELPGAVPSAVSDDEDDPASDYARDDSRFTVEDGEHT